ncbi:hypothetical protein Dtox_2392 [Desulfofarcimen acetoxidans DSM 771]|uniref:NGG1p interacting factor NIF3 n=1 Tax=Desulfofarcimen acetoxidans (strain ATCC 49208 / DSM 771 / KCTC 5769 / VKM B-1644 / 5575) TaxID=485916 RepID=C8W0E8_DESAS|nr:hypothetical protein [Desulfofarcimen acetoxidans]ACV63203.1 hypothetical protein Dtox_2392 [Desulfofarcimen acetoxidans DSM 771]
MKIKEIYQLAVQKGIERDPRGMETVHKLLERVKKRYEDLKEEKRSEFDQDKLFNPYSDTRILAGDPEKEVGRALVGIDIEVGEVLLADRLSERSGPIDLIIAHHPEGKAMSALYQVMHLQEDFLARYGVPINVAEGMMASRIAEVKRGLMPLNHNRAVDAAKILNQSLMCMHTPADNHVVDFLQKIFDEEKPERLTDVIKLLKTIPEYKEAVTNNAGPTIVVGSKERRAGKILVEMTGGTSGSEEVYSKLAQAGIGTVVVMHLNEKHRKEAEKNHVNVVIAGHMASDSLGMNLILDELQKKGIEIIPCAGLIRHSRA